MGLEKNEGRRTFLTISDGQIVRKHQNPVEGTTVTRNDKNGKVVHEEFFRAITGIVTDIRSKETSFGVVWEIVLMDDKEEFILSFNYSSKYTNNFFRAAPNVNWTFPLTINPWSMKDKKDANKKVIGLSLYQSVAGEEKKQKVEFAYTKEDLNGMPDLKKKKVKGKEVWDDSEQLEFFETMLVDDILPQIKKQKPLSVPVPVTAGESASQDEVDENLPF